MRRTIVTLIIPTALWIGIPAPQDPVDLERERAELLKIHRTDRQAHFSTDPELLFSNTADDFISVSQGRVNRPSVAALKTRFREVFRGASYTEWDDLEPPIVRVSPDGRLGWVVVRLRVTRTVAPGTGTPEREQFTYAGLTTFEKRSGRWLKTANVSTFE